MVVYVDQNKLSVKPYQKPLNQYLYIPFNSYHPNHAKRKFINLKAELIRYVRLSLCLSNFLLTGCKIEDIPIISCQKFFLRFTTVHVASFCLELKTKPRCGLFSVF